jgi:four helix bundle protein
MSNSEYPLMPNIELQILLARIAGVWRNLRTFRRDYSQCSVNRGGTSPAIARRMSPPYDINDRSFLFACRIVDFCRPLFSRDPVTRELGRQLLHAGTSVGANLEEAQASQSRPDFRSKIAIARKESRESRYWLRLIAYAEPPLRARTTSLIDESTQIYKILTTIKMNSEANERRGEPDDCQNERDE